MISSGQARPIPVTAVWKELEDELICHKCVKDYSDLTKSHPPQTGAAAALLGNAKKDDDSMLSGIVDNHTDVMEKPDDGSDDDGEVSGGEGEEEDVEAGNTDDPTLLLPPWDPRNKWSDLVKYPLESMRIQNWLNPNQDFGSAAPMIYMCALIGLGEVSSEYFGLCPLI
jgi:hypothetical protein